MKKRIARKIVDGQLKPRYKRINPILSVGWDLLTGKMGLQKIYYCIPIYRKWTTKQLARAKRRLGIKSVTLLPLKIESMPVESDMKLETINV